MQRLGIYVCMIAALAIHVAETQAQHYGGGGGLNGRRRPTGTIGLAGAEGVQASVPSMSFSGAAGQADLPGQSGPRSRPSVLGASGNISAGNRSKASMDGVQSDRAQVGRARPSGGETATRGMASSAPAFSRDQHRGTRQGRSGRHLNAMLGSSGTARPPGLNRRPPVYPGAQNRVD